MSIISKENIENVFLAFLLIPAVIFVALITLIEYLTGWEIKYK